MKLSKWTLLLVAVMVTAALLPVAAKSQGNAAPAGNVNNGKELYLKYGCYACHGYQGQGGVAGPHSIPRAAVQSSRCLLHWRTIGAGPS